MSCENLQANGNGTSADLGLAHMRLKKGRERSEVKL
jgi:hypothetical protein